MTEPIYAIFDRIQHCIVLNTSVKSISKKFLTQLRHLATQSSAWVFTCKIKREHCIQMPISLKYLYQFAQFWHS